MENTLILITSSEDDQEAENKSQRECEEYRVIADLSGFENLRAMIEAEAFMRRKKRKRKKKKRKIVYEAQEKVGGAKEEEWVDEIKSAESTKVLETEIVISENDEPQMTVVGSAKDEEQVGKIKAVETKKAFKGNDHVKSAIVVDLCLSTSESKVIADMSRCRGVVEMVPVEPITTKKKKKKKKKRRKWNIKIIKAAGTEGKLAEGCIGVETMISLETESVEIKDNLVLRKLLRRPRYFDPPDSSWNACSNCGEEDHTAMICTAQKRKKPCFVCGSFEHSWKHCKQQDQDCFFCKGRGHIGEDCPEKNQENHWSSKICLRCGDSGHDMLLCRSDYSPDDIKKIQCYVCNNFGHLCCTDFPDMGPTQVSCYKCAQTGHLGSECTESCRGTSSSKSYEKMPQV